MPLPKQRGTFAWACEQAHCGEVHFPNPVSYVTVTLWATSAHHEAHSTCTAKVTVQRQQERAESEAGIPDPEAQTTAA